MRYKLTDSHRNMTKASREALSAFLAEVKGVSGEVLEQQLCFAEWFRHEYSAICFEGIAYDGAVPVGYMRCFNDPDDRTRWFVGDVHVRADHRRRGIADRLYRLAIDEVMRYERAERIEASISENNTASIRLHEGLGFADTGRPGCFADFSFMPEETFFRRYLYSYMPVPPVTKAAERIAPVWEEIRKDFGGEESRFLAMSANEIGERGIIGGEFEVISIWCGNRLVGISLDDGAEHFEHILPQK